MRHWNSPNSNLLTVKKSEMNENKSGANTRDKVYALYKQICFRQQLILILSVALSFLGGISTEDHRNRAVYTGIPL